MRLKSYALLWVNPVKSQMEVRLEWIGCAVVKLFFVQFSSKRHSKVSQKNQLAFADCLNCRVDFVTCNLHIDWQAFQIHLRTEASFLSADKQYHLSKLIWSYLDYLLSLLLVVNNVLNIYGVHCFWGRLMTPIKQNQRPIKNFTIVLFIFYYSNKKYSASFSHCCELQSRKKKIARINRTNLQLIYSQVLGRVNLCNCSSRSSAVRLRKHE